MDNKKLGNRIASLRKQNNLSQKELAEKLCVSNKTVSKWECGNGNPDIDTLLKLSHIFNVKLEDFISNEEQIPSGTTEVSLSKKTFPKLLISISSVIVIIAALLLYFFIPRPPQIKSSNVFTINNNTNCLNYTVDNDIDSFSFNGSIVLPKTNKWTLYFDINGVNQIPSKSVSLEVGDNQFFIMVENNAGTKRIYSVNIRRKPIYSVTFITDGGEPVLTQYVMEGDFAESMNTNKDGYIFDGWDYDFTQPIINDTIITASWLPITSTITYNINYGSEESTIQSVAYDTKVTLLSDGYDRIGYTLVSWNTKKDGSGTRYSLGKVFTKYNIKENIILYAQWEINKHSISLSKNIINAGDINGGGVFDYGTTITLSATSNLGYRFIGWYDGETNISESLIYTYQVGDSPKQFIAKWELDFSSLENFNFETTTTKLTITGLKNKNLKNIVIPTCVTHIDGWAFQDNPTLETIVIEYGTTYIGTFAFKNCTALKSINIPDSVKTINDGAFLNCSSLKQVIIPSSVTSIGQQVFSGCTSLESLSVDTKNTVFKSKQNCIIKNSGIIYGCKTSIIPEDEAIHYISDWAFMNCSTLKSIHIPKNIISLDADSFYGCYSLETITVDIANGAYYSKDNCLINKSSNTIILGCRNSIIPSNIADIGGYSFVECKTLTSINIPRSVKNIGSFAFYFCEKLTSIIYEGTKAEWETIKKGDHWDHGTPNYIVHCSDGILNK